MCLLGRSIRVHVRREALPEGWEAAAPSSVARRARLMDGLSRGGRWRVAPAQSESSGR